MFKENKILLKVHRNNKDGLWNIPLVGYDISDNFIILLTYLSIYTKHPNMLKISIISQYRPNITQNKPSPENLKKNL